MCDGWAGNTAPCAAAGNPGYAGDVRNASAGNSDDACTGAYPNSAPSTALGKGPLRETGYLLREMKVPARTAH